MCKLLYRRNTRRICQGKFVKTRRVRRISMKEKSKTFQKENREISLRENLLKFPGENLLKLRS